ncbi:SUMF1/EgtB/PvdO family nonheme iron enzyme [uncultured Bacteroides sp.]|uniref:formylglycine-generating enzyme family protein n=1 Tax=uncultured Bacteroides sp. TaxID=162156 RepID=UPI0025E8813D|nr:SUMF1/EgtB/PvdO family nonheme iron enzyme [uncultured Bacteroides sp.]
MRLFFYSILLGLSLGIQAQTYVRIGLPNNVPCSLGTGAVTYEYEIGETEVTNSEYCFFLNNVAATDYYNLYSKLMSQHPFGGIIREGNEGEYKYRVKEGYEDKPVAGVTWNSAVRYINWLHYNARNIELGNSNYLPYTEGDVTTGAYNTTDFGTDNATITCARRNSKAVYWLPNEDEWIKAAFYNPNTKKWNENALQKGANVYDKHTGWLLSYPHLKDIKASVEASPFGTFDQQGNVAEWVENGHGGWRKALGGSLIRPKNFAAINEHEGDAPNKTIISFGFRVCRDASKALRTKIVRVYSPKKSVQQSSGNRINDGNGGSYVLCNEAGNKGDIVNQYRGCVGYDFYISKYELTNGEYCRFLNAVARTSDPYHLYNDNMSRGICGNIEKNNKGNLYIYSVNKGNECKPVVYIHYCDLARYVNWLHYGCPDTGKSELGTTEGNELQGAYNTTDFEDVRSGKKNVYAAWGKRNKGAKYWIPSDDEWYKAAYYDPTIIGNRKYHDYPTRTSDAPAHDKANYLVADSILNAETFVVDVDCFANSASYFGTQQQGGNVWEWTEDWQYGIVGCRGLRGGSWSYTAYGLNSINIDPGGLDDFNYVFGGRLCKAINENGWQPVEKSVIEKLYKWWLLLSPMKVLLFQFLFVIGLISIVTNIIQLLKIIFKYGHKKKN